MCQIAEILLESVAEIRTIGELSLRRKIAVVSITLTLLSLSILMWAKWGIDYVNEVRLLASLHLTDIQLLRDALNNLVIGFVRCKVS